MLTLSDISNSTNSNDGELAQVYSDLYKDVYGSRPRYATFESVEEFRTDFEALVNELGRKEEKETIQQQKNFEAFISRVDVVQELVPGTDRQHAIEILADGEDELEGMKFYGYERIEWKLNLKFGSIKRWLAE